MCVVKTSSTPMSSPSSSSYPGKERFFIFATFLSVPFLSTFHPQVFFPPSYISYLLVSLNVLVSTSLCFLNFLKLTCVDVYVFLHVVYVLAAFVYFYLRLALYRMPKCRLSTSRQFSFFCVWSTEMPGMLPLLACREVITVGLFLY